MQEVKNIAFSHFTLWLQGTIQGAKSLNQYDQHLIGSKLYSLEAQDPYSIKSRPANPKSETSQNWIL